MTLDRAAALGFGVKMCAIVKCSAIVLVLAAVTPANAKACLKAHYMVHPGAAAACVIHQAKKQREKSEHPTLRKGED